MKNLSIDDLQPGDIVVVNCPPKADNIMSKFTGTSSGHPMNGCIVGIVALDLPYAVVVPLFDKTGTRYEKGVVAVELSSIQFAKPGLDFVSLLSGNKIKSLTFNVKDYVDLPVHRAEMNGDQNPIEGDEFSDDV